MPLRFESLPMLLTALSLALAIAIIAGIRRIAMPRLSHGMIGAGLILLSLAAGGAQWRRARTGDVVVMVDLSPSTRTAAYRSRATLERRISLLLGNAPRRIVYFSDEVRPDQPGELLADMPCDHTVFAPPSAEAVLLFSDGQFELPASGPRTFVVIDPELEEPIDAAVTRLEARGSDLVASVRVVGQSRELSLNGTAATRPINIERGSRVISRPLSGAEAAARFNAADAWPENDGLWLIPPPQVTTERWWVGAEPTAGWRAFEARTLPNSSAAYLAPAVIVLNNIPAGAIAQSQSLLQQYVRDLGGTLVILGGDRAFAAGDYGSSVLEGMSPLASYPPKPAMQWIILVDGSGSMGEATHEGTRWQSATLAIKQLLPHLPPEDLATLGSFAENVSWWSTGKSVRETMGTALPPVEISPRGPTNLQRAIEDAARSVSGAMPKKLILVTDADALIDGALKIASELNAKHISLHVLAIGTGSGLAELRKIAVGTRGDVTSILDAKSWTAGLLEMGRSAMPVPVERSLLRLRFMSPLQLPARDVSPWNRHWMKGSATALAEAQQAKEPTFPAAAWRYGAGQVVAAAFAANARESAALAEAYARPPRDPRFSILWDSAGKLRVSIEAVEGTRILNGESFTLELRNAGSNESAKMQAISQTAPGKYEVSIPSPRDAMFASVRHGGQILDQIAVAGRYAPEFDAIGNDHDAMHELARRTGGDVIDVRQIKLIDFHWPMRDIALASWLACLGAVCIAVGLGWWRLG